MQQSKVVNRDQVYIIQSMNDVKRWMEQFDIVGSPYKWNRLIDYHGRKIDGSGKVLDLKETEVVSTPSQKEPTPDQYSKMSVLEQRLTRQTFLIRNDLCKLRRHTFFTWNEEAKKSEPETDDQSKQRGRAWVWVTQCFVKFPHVYRSCVVPQDLFSLFAKLCEITKPPPPVVRQRRAEFFSTYIKVREPYLRFAERLNRCADELSGLGVPISTQGRLNALLGGVSYHACWKAGDNPQPMLTKSRFYQEVEKIDLQNQLSATTTGLEEIDARLERVDKLVSVTMPSHQSEAHFTDGGGATKHCYKFQAGNCNYGSKCRFSHTISGAAGASPGGNTQTNSNSTKKLSKAMKKLCSEKKICMLFQQKRCKLNESDCKYTHKIVMLDSSGKCRRCHKVTHEDTCKFKVSANNAAEGKVSDDSDNDSDGDEVIGTSFR